MIDISNFSVMNSKCWSCPFVIDLSLSHQIMNRCLESSQVCHHPRLSGKKETHLCRGARDYQLEIFHRLGIISEPTDESWSKTEG